MALVRSHPTHLVGRADNLVRMARRGTGPQAFRPTTG